MRRRAKTHWQPSPALLYWPETTPPEPGAVATFKEFEQLPPEVRKAVNDCPYYIRIRPRRGMGWVTCIEEIAKISDYAQAKAFTEKWTRA